MCIIVLETNMKWFDRWLVRKFQMAWQNRDQAECLPEPGAKYGRISKIEEDISPDSWSDGLRITVKKIIGGCVVSFRTYDRQRDRVEDRHYIITDDKDFNTELGKMITLESMRQS